MNFDSVISKFFRAVDSFSEPETAFAHCDIPCGIYETDSISHAAETVYKMDEKLLALKVPANDSERLAFVHDVARMTHTKEEFAHKCKQELLILWTDYFKPEHLQKFPDLHEKFWKATKQCSTVKRAVNLQEAQKLKDMVHDIAHMFADSKK